MKLMGTAALERDAVGAEALFLLGYFDFHQATGAYSLPSLALFLCFSLGQRRLPICRSTKFKGGFFID